MNSSHNSLFETAVISTASKLICIGSLIWFGLIVIGSIDALTPRREEMPPETHPASDFSDLMNFQNGYWAFADTSLTTQKISCGQSELDKHIKEIARAINCTASNVEATELIQIAESVGVERVELPSKNLWSYDGPESRIRLVTSRDETPFLISAAIAMKTLGCWELTTLQPRETSKAHLLPLPSETKSLCSRHDSVGCLQFELLSTTETGQQLLDHWRRFGWQVRQTPWGSVDGFSYLCIQGEKTVYAWSKSTNGKRNLMLTAASSQSDIATTKPTQKENTP